MTNIILAMIPTRPKKAGLLMMEGNEGETSALLSEIAPLGLDIVNLETVGEIILWLENKGATAVVIGPSASDDDLKRIVSHRGLSQTKIPVLCFPKTPREDWPPNVVVLTPPVAAGAIRERLIALCHLHQEVRVLRQELEAMRSREEDFHHLGSIIAHDLRSPLTIVMGYTDLLLDQSSINDLEKSHVECIKKASHKMLELLNAMERFHDVKGREMKVSACGIEVCQKAIAHIDEIIHAHRAKVTIEEWVDFEADPELLSTLLVEVIQNSILHGDAHPEVVVRARLVDERRQTVVSLSRPLVVVEVIDNGPGVSHDKREVVFQPFERLNSKHKGHGLGLSIAHRIMDRHGGTITLHGGEAHGAIVFMTFPRYQKDRLL